MRTPITIRTASAAAAGLLLTLLSACNSQPNNIVVGPQDDMKEALSKAKPVELPPALVASKSYRCEDNSVVYVDYFGDNKSANLRVKSKTSTPIMLKADQPGQPMTAEGGYAVSGQPGASSVQVTLPGKKEQACTA